MTEQCTVGRERPSKLDRLEKADVCHHDEREPDCKCSDEIHTPPLVTGLFSMHHTSHSSISTTPGTIVWLL